MCMSLVHPPSPLMRRHTVPCQVANRPAVSGRVESSGLGRRAEEGAHAMDLLHTWLWSRRPAGTLPPFLPLRAPLNVVACGSCACLYAMDAVVWLLAVSKGEQQFACFKSCSATSHGPRYGLRQLLCAPGDPFQEIDGIRAHEHRP